MHLPHRFNHTRSSDSNRLWAPRHISELPWIICVYLCICVYLRLSVISAGIICVSSAPIRDFDREPSLRLTRHHRNIISPSSHFLPHHQNIITYHMTFLFPLFAQPTTPTLPMLKFAPSAPAACPPARACNCATYGWILSYCHYIQTFPTAFFTYFIRAYRIRTFHARHTRNCALRISTRLLAASALFVQVNVEIPARSA